MRNKTRDAPGQKNGVQNAEKKDVDPLPQPPCNAATKQPSPLAFPLLLLLHLLLLLPLSMGQSNEALRRAACEAADYATRFPTKTKTVTATAAERHNKNCDPHSTHNKSNNSNKGEIGGGGGGEAG